MKTQTGGDGSHWCPIDRMALGDQLWSYTWQDCSGMAITQSISTRDLSLGCPNPLSTPPAAPCGEASPPPVDDTSGSGPNMSAAMATTTPVLTSARVTLNPRTSGEKGLIRQGATQLGRVAGTDRYVRLHQFEIGARVSAKGVSSPPQSFRIGVEIDAREAAAIGGQPIELKPDAASPIVPGKLMLLSPPGARALVPVFPR